MKLIKPWGSNQGFTLCADELYSRIANDRVLTKELYTHRNQKQLQMLHVLRLRKIPYKTNLLKMQKN